MSDNNKKFSTVPLNWKEVYNTNCPRVSISNMELGRAREDFKKIEVKYGFFAPATRTTWYPHYIIDLIASSAGR